MSEKPREIKLPTRLPDPDLTPAQRERRASVAALQSVIQRGVKPPASGIYGRPKS